MQKMGFWIAIGIAMAVVAADEILERKVRDYTEKKYAFLKAIGAIPRVTK